MTLISRIGSAILFLAVILPVVSAHGGGGGFDNNDGHNDNKHEKGCGSGEFLFGWKNVCLPIGGRHNRPKPPKGSDCPPTKWYWGDREGCCIPEEPPKHDDPEPQCHIGWKWLSGEHRCCEDDDHPKPPHPHPSGKPHGCPGGCFDKRAMKSRAAPLCSSGFEACPISRMSKDYECLDTQNELKSCGGCPALGKGQNCMAIKGAQNVACVKGICQVSSCGAGLKPSPDRRSCSAH